MKRKLILAPSILSADFTRLGEETKLASSSGAGMVHIDIMDGVFVPRTIGSTDWVKEAKQSVPSLFRDVHLMVEHPQETALRYAASGADNVTFHLEACSDEKEIWSTMLAIEKAGSRASFSLKPMTPPEAMLPYLSSAYLILVMSVEPGKGGQSFMMDSLKKIAFLRKKIDLLPAEKRPLIEVDGGINPDTAKLCAEAGADVLVAGSYLFGHPDMRERAQKILEAGR